MSLHPTHFTSQSQDPFIATSVKDCHATLAILTEPGSRFEIRVIPQGKYQRFDSTPEGLQEAAEYAASWSDNQSTKGVYVTLNPIGIEPEKAATDACIARRRWLLIDVDPVRPPDTNATEGEREASSHVWSHAGALLTVYGGFRFWSIMVHSGNGYHSLYPIDLPNDDASRDLIKGILTELARLSNKVWATVDTSVYNASRIVKLYGTWTRKGPHSEDRPWRKSCLYEKFHDITPYPASQLYQLYENLQHLGRPERSLINPQPALDGPRVAEETIIDATFSTPAQEPPHDPQNNGQDSHWKMHVGGRPDALTRARAYLAACSPAISGQGGHDQTYKASKVGPGFDLPYDDALHLLWTDYNPRCKPPWSEQELRHKLDDAYKDPKNQPRGWLLNEERPRNEKGDAQGKTKAKNEHEEPEPDLDDIATLADVRREIGNLKYTWKGWIQPGTITSVAADAGTGKTLVVLKLCQIAWNGDPWPDGATNEIPKGSRSLWLCYDRAWPGILRAVEKMGLPDEAIILPSRKKKPLWVPDLDNPKTIPWLERLIRKHKPWALVIDTMTYATNSNMARAHEAKFAYSPIMGVIAETSGCCISNTHLNSEGKVLNIRPTELCRTVIKLKAPDPENPKRLRMWVDKTDDERPSALGVTLGGEKLVEFDDRPPSSEGGEPKHRGPAPEKSAGFASWLFTYLKPGPAPISEIIESARDQGLLKKPDEKNPKPSISSLYNAKTRIPKVYPGWIIDEFEQILPSGKTLKTWQRLQTPEEDDDAPPF